MILHFCLHDFRLHNVCKAPCFSSEWFKFIRVFFLFPSLGFLRRNRRKDKKKKANNDSTLSEGADVSVSKEGVGSDGEEMRKSETPTPEVDDEGFSKQPEVGNDPWSDFNKKESNFYSSSDDSGRSLENFYNSQILNCNIAKFLLAISDDETTKRKIKVEIKPIANGGAPISASVDELRSAVGAIELLNPPPVVVSY